MIMKLDTDFLRGRKDGQLFVKVSTNEIKATKSNGGTPKKFISKTMSYYDGFATSLRMHLKGEEDV